MHPVALAVMTRVLPQGRVPAVLVFVIDIVASVAVARGFFLLIERHFLNTPPRAEPKL
jgi:hypothetical protein